MIGSKSVCTHCLFSKGKSLFLKTFHSIVHDPFSVLRFLNDHLFFSVCSSFEAKSEAFVVNPFINNCDLSINLTGDKWTRICVQIITRVSESGKNEEKEEAFKLEQECISLIHNNRLVHANIILVDYTVALIFSMNFCSDSSTGVSLEDSLVSTDDKIVKSTVNSVLTKFT